MKTILRAIFVLMLAGLAFSAQAAGDLIRFTQSASGTLSAVLAGSANPCTGSVIFPMGESSVTLSGSEYDITSSFAILDPPICPSPPQPYEVAATLGTAPDGHYTVVWTVGSLTVRGTFDVAAGILQSAAVNASCALFGNGTTYTPQQSWPFDTVRIQVAWVPTCTNFFCLRPPALVGATAHVDGTRIMMDIYGSNDALPAGVPVSPPPSPSGFPYYATATVGPLAQGSYTVLGVVHGVANGVVSDLCTSLPPFATVVIEKAAGPVATRAAIEFYNAAREHYFITAEPTEIADLDDGTHPGWTRTGKAIAVFVPGESGGVGTPVCRFYGLPAAGLDSHFYTANQAECSAIPDKFHGAWLLESNDVFDMRLPDPTSGACGGAFAPVYRLWNNRSDSNHRFTTDLAVVRDMQARGYVLEGWGSDPSSIVSMCSPP